MSKEHTYRIHTTVKLQSKKNQEINLNVEILYYDLYLNTADSMKRSSEEMKS